MKKDNIQLTTQYVEEILENIYNKNLENKNVREIVECTNCYNIFVIKKALENVPHHKRSIIAEIMIEHNIVGDVNISWIAENFVKNIADIKERIRLMLKLLNNEKVTSFGANRLVFRCAFFNLVDVTRELINHNKVTENCLFNTALEANFFPFNKRIVKILIKSGKVDYEGIGNAVYVFSLGNLPKMLEMVIASERVKKEYLEEALDYVIRQGEGDFTNIIKILLKHGADPNAKNIHGQSIRDYVIEKKHTDILKLFDEFGKEEQSLYVGKIRNEKAAEENLFRKI